MTPSSTVEIDLATRYSFLFVISRAMAWVCNMVWGRRGTYAHRVGQSSPWLQRRGILTRDVPLSPRQKLMKYMVALNKNLFPSTSQVKYWLVYTLDQMALAPLHARWTHSLQRRGRWRSTQTKASEIRQAVLIAKDHYARNITMLFVIDII
jgi:hypothetical protein